MAEINIKRMGAYIASRRRELGMSQRSLASIAKSRQSYICEIENGQKEASIAFIGKLADALQVPPAWICQFAYEDPYAEA
jgi:transcriptional regulator with XRE-family HTH domain